MQPTRRNDPCPCGSGKKYKKCCQLKVEMVNMDTFRYEKFLQTRSSTADKMMNNIGTKLNISPMDVISFLTDSPIFINRDVDLFSYSEYEGMLFSYIVNSVYMYAYPVNDSNIFLWEQSLSEFNYKFSQEEITFLKSIKNYKAGFFQAKEIDAEKYFINAEDILTLEKYKIIDMGLSKGIVKNDIFCGMAIPYNEDLHILEGGAPIIFPPLEKKYIKETVTQLYKYNKVKIPGNENEKLSKFLNLHPISMYRTVLDYHYLSMERPMPKIMTTDNEELEFSKTTYKLSDRNKVKSCLLKIRGMSISEENEEETVFSWENEKNIIMATLFLRENELYFETNSSQRLEKMKNLLKKTPVEFVATDHTDIQSILNKQRDVFLDEDDNLGKENQSDIPGEAIREFALDYWDKYYNDWVSSKIPLLDNKTPLEAVRSEKYRQKVIDLIDDHENKTLHIIKNGGGNIQGFFNADELRKRLNL